MNHCIPDGSIASSHRPREFFWCQLRNHMEEFLVSPVAIVVKNFQVLDGHLMLLTFGIVQLEPKRARAICFVTSQLQAPIVGCIAGVRPPAGISPARSTSFNPT